MKTGTGVSTKPRAIHNSALRRHLENSGLYYVLAIPANEHVIANPTSTVAGGEHQVDRLAADLAGTSWKTRSAGAGTKGERLYDWARVRINGPGDASHWLLVRRNRSDSDEVAYYLCYAPKTVTLARLIQVAGTRWAIEESFQTAKGQTGLDHYQVRQYSGWYRHITLSMFAHAFLTVIRSAEAKKGAA